MLDLLRKLDGHAAARAARSCYTVREALLLCAFCTIFAAGMAVVGFAGDRSLIHAWNDPRSDRSLICFLLPVLTLFCLASAGAAWWLVRYLRHTRRLAADLEFQNYSPDPDGARTQIERDPETGLPVTWPLNHRYGIRDLVAFVSGFGFIGGLPAAIIWLLAGFSHSQSVVFLLPYSKYLVPVELALLIALVGAASKYAWLITMSRWLRKAEVAPWIAWGVPRRLSRLDRRILERYYNQ